MSTNNTEATASEQPEQQPANGPPPPRLSVIGVGASAGGLAALRAFFGALPERSGLTFVVVVHLSPEHESVLASLLQPYTPMPVTQVTARTEMQPDHVYVIPPGKHLVVTATFLELADLEPLRQRQPQIDAFFRSLAESHGDGGAVILSGSGSDGAVGIQALKEKGGLILVQAPEEAEYDSMPRSAIATGLVDMVAPAAQLATQLVAAKQTHPSIQLPADGEQLSTSAQTTLTQLLAQLRLRTGHDFSGYKPATILRRISRRMQITQLTTLTAYLQRLRQDPHEAEALFRDLLINVTEFFRDPEAWAALESTIIPQLFVGKGRNDRVRVWSVGCATGEEAYSIAMLLLQYADELVAPPTIQVFASDLGKAVLDFARDGCYSAAIADSIPAPRLARFFTKENSHYRVRPELREAILFTQHNLLQAPPFSRLDLIICRNLLIYIQRDLQEKVFETFSYALRPEGYLFLGNAESAEGITDLFETVDKQRRLYQRRPQTKAVPILPSLPLLTQPAHVPTLGAESPRPGPARPSEEHRLLLEAVAPPSVLVDRDYNVLHLSEAAGRYLLPPGGPPTVEVLKLVRPELQSALRAALLRAFDENHAVTTQPIPVRFNGDAHPVYLMVRPHPLADGQMRALVIFLEAETPLADTLVEDNLSQPERRQLEAELRNVQSRLQSMREEYETTVEELRAANEELQSTNEEYKSTLEELETSKEELQSVNEELQTINQELKNKIDEVTHAHNDVQNLFIATDIATLFLDRELRVKRYTPRAADLFNLMPTDRGRPIAHLRTTLRYEQLEGDAQRVLAHLTPVEREVQSQDGRWFLVCSRPYRTLEDKIDGVVITFVDITANKTHEEALRNAKEYAESIVHTIPDALLVLEPDLRVQMANDAFYEIFQVQPAGTEGRLIYELGNGQWNIPALRTLLEEILPENKVFIGYEVEHTFEQIGRRTMLVNGRQLDHVQLILLAITDITERKRAEEALRASEEKYRTLFESIDEGFCVMEVVHDERGRSADIIYCEANAAFEQHTGLSDAVGKRASELFPHLEQRWLDVITRVHQTGVPERMEGYNADLNRWITAQYSSMSGADSPFVAAVFNDITERKRNELNLAFLAEVSTEFAAVTSADAVINYIGEKLAHYLGLSRCDFSVVEEEADRITTIYDWRRAADAPSVLGEHAISTFLTPLARQQYIAGELAVINDVHHDPRINAPPAMMDALHIRAVVDAPYLENGRWKFLLSACRAEVSVWRTDEIELIRELAVRIYIRLQRAYAEENLRESEGRLRVMIENLPGGAVFIVDHKLHYLLAEGEALYSAGFVPGDLVGKNLLDALPHEVAMVYEPMYRQALAGTPFLHEHESHGRAYVSRGTPLREAGGEIYGVLVVSYDITDRKEAEVALQHLNATLEQTVDARTAQVRTLASKLTMAEQEERRRVSQILHDDLQQLLYGMQMRMMAIMNDLKAGHSDSLLAYVQEVYNWMSDAIQTTRRLTVDLSPPLLKGEGLADALRWLIPQMATVNGLEATLEVVEPCDIPNQGMRVLLFQIVRELLFNVVKHAGVNTATVVLQQEGDACVIKVSDAGHGFDPAAVAAKGEKGFGLFSIDERLKLFDGRMTIQSAPGQGTTITVYAPVIATV